MPKQQITIQDLAKIKAVGEPQVSPDGSRVLFTVKAANTDKNKYFSHLWVRETASRRSRQFTFGEVNDVSPRWSHDGQAIAFIRTKDKRSQIWVVPSDGGEARPLTDLPEGGFSDLNWSPDGRFVAFSFRPTRADRTKEAGNKREENGTSTPPRVVTRTHYRLDGSGYMDERQHVWICDVGTSESTRITRGDYDDHSPAWAPDSRTIVFISNRSSDPDRLQYKDDIWLVDAHGAKLTRVPTPEGWKDKLAWSPDGTQLAYTGPKLGKDPWRPLISRLWLVSKKGGDARCLGFDLDRSIGNQTLADTREASPAVPLWSSDGKRIFASLSDSGAAQLFAFESASGKATALTRGALDISGISADAATRFFALAISTPTEPTEIFTGTLDGSRLGLEQLTHQNEDWLKGVSVSEPEEFWITQPDGARIQGWVMRPPRLQRGKRYPALVYVHGGPHSQYGSAFFHELQWHAARGYVVVYSNPRGSNGRGEEFGAVIHRNWGSCDFDDVMAVADYAERLPYVDKSRMAIAGGSYGGYMTNWVVGHTNRFRCAITDRCLSNFITMAGTTDVPPPPGTYWPGNPWGEDYARGWDTSPIKYVENVRTPMLIIHSEGDLRCPISQAEEWFTALKWLRQEAIFVRYPQETSHGLSRNGPIDLRLDRLQRIGDWLDSHLQEPKRRKKTRRAKK